ncbi:MAG: ATP phosphoribosyltransferase regulatory subunit, partial [Rhodospirillales bacterium]|nr:ATP phosphoribosyltransferase regulatory subunit [Rhodospirillales bacterium]
ARLPRGFVDRHAADIRAVDAMTAEIRKVYELYGFEPVEQPMVEYTDALGKFLPDQDRPNEGVFSFQDDDSQEARSGGAATGKTYKDKGNTKDVWVCDLRTNIPPYGKTRPMTRQHFADFEAEFGDDPYGNAKRTDTGEQSRFRCYTRDAIAARGDNLDITWLRDESAGDGTLPDPEIIAAEIIDNLRAALEEMEALTAELEGEEPEEAEVGVRAAE